MKTITTILALVVAFVTTALQTNAQNTTSSQMAPVQQYQDGEKLAQAYLNHVTAYYRGEVYATRITNGVATQISISFIMGGDLWITNMSIDGTQIPLSKPLSGIPIPVSGYQGFDIYLNGYDKNGGSSGSGQFYTNALLPGDAISVVMEPTIPPLFIALSTDNPNSLSVFLSGNLGYGYYYDSSRGGLIIFPGDGLTDADYIVQDANGNILARGHYRAYTAPSTATPAMTVNVRQAGGVQNAELGSDGYRYFQNQAFDCQVVRNDAWVPAKVYNTSNLGRSQLYLVVQSDDAVRVEVRRPSATGEMSIVSVHTAYYNGGYIEIISDEFLDNAVITVLPATTSTSPKKFNIYVGTTTGSGGKG